MGRILIYNTTYHSSIKMTHFQALYGDTPPNIPAIKREYIHVNKVDP